MFGTKKSFTLAETLITLVIIGVVAALTIPALVNKTQNQELKASFKKTYSALEQATRQIMQDNGGTMLGVCSSIDQNCFLDKYSAQLAFTKKCEDGHSWGACWHDGDGFYYDGITRISAHGNHTGLVLNDGTLIDFYYDSPTCTAPIGTLYKCARIRVDVNGFKPPNSFGKDIFGLNVYQNGIKPYGFIGDNMGTACPPVNSVSGVGCAAKVLMNQDY